MSVAWRSIPRASRAAVLIRPSISSSQPRRTAHQSYGNDQSGHPQARDQPNPKADLEHPGPESPASKGGAQKSASTPSTASSSSGGQSSRPAIHHPKAAAEDHDPEVRKHNEDLRNRHDQSANQLAEEDNKVDKDFWKGDVGDPKKNRS